MASIKYSNIFKLKGLKSQLTDFRPFSLHIFLYLFELNTLIYFLILSIKVLMSSGRLDFKERISPVLGDLKSNEYA